MSEKFIALLTENGIDVEVKTRKPTTLKVGEKEFWFRKTQDDIENFIPLGVTNEKMDFLFVSVKNDDYVNAKYLVGRYSFLEQNLKDNESLRIAESQFVYDFQQIVKMFKK